MRRLHARVHQLVEPAGPRDRASRIVDLTLIALILGDFVAFVLETIPEISSYHLYFAAFAQIALAFFVVEYAARLWSITANERFRRPVYGRLRWMVTPMAIVDLVAITPAFFYSFHYFVGGEMAEVPGQLALLRTVRLARLFKIARYSPAIVTVQRALHRVRHEMNVMLAGIFVILIVSSTLLHAVESEVQPEAFGSLPEAFWYALITMTTVGFGDVIAVTPWGMLITSLLAISGIALFALPSGLLAAAFAAEIRRARGSEQHSTSLRCPHCEGWMRYDTLTSVAFPEERPEPIKQREGVLPEEPV